MRVLFSVVFCALVGIGSAQLGVSQADPCTHPHDVVGDITYCDRYWECVHGEAQLYDCPNGLVFIGRNRGIAEGCDYPWRSNHCDPTHVGSNKQLANAPISTEHCDWLYGIFGHETSCTRYWTCWNGTSTEQFCIGGLLYNEETHACDWPQNVAGCQKHPLCKDDPNANVPLGQSCERYWSCQGGYPRLQRCPATLVFDKLSTRCVAPPTVDCDVPSTTPAPEEQSSFREGGGPPRQNRPRQQGQQVRNRQRTQVQEEQVLSQPQNQQFVDNTLQFVDDSPPPQQTRQQSSRPRPSSPNRAQLPSNFRLPPGLTGAIPLQLNARSSRPSPIDGAVALN